MEIDDIEITVNHSVVIGFGDDLKNINDVRVVIERENILPMPSVLTAVECCLASYYVFNLQYESRSKALCHLLEFLYGMDISKHTHKLPLNVKSVIEALL